MFIRKYWIYKINVRFLCSFFLQQFGGGAGTDMTKFPEFKWQEPKLDPINQESA